MRRTPHSPLRLTNNHYHNMSKQATASRKIVQHHTEGFNLAFEEETARRIIKIAGGCNSLVLDLLSLSPEEHQGEVASSLEWYSRYLRTLASLVSTVYAPGQGREVANSGEFVDMGC